MTISLQRPADARRHRALAGAIAVCGAALIAAAIAAHQSWLDRHFLPSFFVPRDWYVRAETIARAAIACGGVLLIAIARPLGRFVAGRPSRPIAIVAAALLALGASDVVLRIARPRPLGWLVPTDEPLRQPDARLGWSVVPSRLGRTMVAGRTIEYAIDVHGYRVRRLAEPTDPTRPTILFVGESVIFGQGLNWDDTVPARVGAMLHLQAANLAVPGYSTDQSYLRLEQELPSFRQPVVVVGLLMTSLFGRNLDDDRPRLGPGLVWRPAERPSRLASLVALLVPFRRERTVADGVRMTRDTLRAMADLALGRGAAPLVVVPQIGRESPPEELLRHRVLDGLGVPSVFVELDPAAHLPWDRHPDARAAQLIASSIAETVHIRGVFFPP